MKLASKLSVLAFAALLAAGPACAEEKVLREGQVTSQSLIEALGAAPAAAPAEEAASAPEGQPRTRSFRASVRPAAAAAGTAATAAGPARASILVTFVTGSAELTPQAKKALKVLGEAMNSQQLSARKFTIEGHADPRGTEDGNLKLSQARAESVREYLVSQEKVGGERINAVGKGSTALMNTADPAAPENRRVTIVAQPN